VGTLPLRRGDPLQYDLVLNTSRFSVERCAHVIVAALDAWQRQAEDSEELAAAK
jgi:cytidylate kinase